MLYSLVMLILLGLGIGCKKEVEPVKPLVVISPPQVDNSKCRIMKETYKTIIRGDNGIDAEDVMIGGKNTRIYKSRENRYEYDATGRLGVESYSTLITGTGGAVVGRVEYSYLPT